MKNDKQIAKAVKCWKEGEHIHKSDECLGVLIDLAIQYLEIGGVIKEINSIPQGMHGQSTCSYLTDGYVEGYNKGRHDTLLAIAKRLERLPNLISNIRYVQPGGYPTDNKIMADAIREDILLEGANYGTSRK